MLDQRGRASLGRAQDLRRIWPGEENLDEIGVRAERDRTDYHEYACLPRGRWIESDRVRQSPGELPRVHPGHAGPGSSAFTAKAPS
jgi:hypothetical protein